MAVDVYRYENVMIIGKKNLITDVKGILVGNSHDDEVKTGVSVLHQIRDLQLRCQF